MNRSLLLVPFLLIAACAVAMPDNSLEPWPSAGAGETRFVVRLPALDEEAGRRIELQIGQDLEVDCNLHWFDGTLDRGMVEGWGYPMYRLVDVTGPASSRRACPGDQARTAFVSARLEDPFLPYSSKQPIVVYVPEGFIVRYRVWSAADVMQDALAE